MALNKLVELIYIFITAHCVKLPGMRSTAAVQKIFQATSVPVFVWKL